MALENVRAVVFDAFGTLIDIGERRRPYLRLMKLAAAAGRRPQPDDAARIMSMDCDIWGAAEWLGVEVSDVLRAEIEADLAAELGSIALFSDALPLTNFLRSQGIKVAICSNLAQPYATAVRALLPDLDAYIFSFEVGAVKPNPEIYLAICEKLDLAPDQIAMIGDTYEADCAGSRKFGMSARHLARHGGSPDADAVVSLSDLLAVESEQPGWQECIDDQTGKRTWIPMSLAQSYQRQQMAARGLLAESDEEEPKAFSADAEYPAALRIEEQIEQSLSRSKDAVFLRKDFNKFGSYGGVGRALRNLIKNGGLVKAGYGVYVKARASSVTGRPIPVLSLIEIGLLVLLKLGVRADVSRASKAYMEGKTTQMPMAAVVNVGNARVSRKIGFGKQALRYEREKAAG